MTRLLSDAATVRRRFLTLLGLRWLQTGLLIPVVVLLPLERGLSLGQVGLAFAAQGLIVLVLELPTGGLADVIGRRRVLLMAGAFQAAAVALATVADSLLLFALVFALQGVYRALESGPLDSWYVDTAQAVDPQVSIERGLSLGGVVTSVAIGVGTLGSSALVALAPLPGINPLVTPLIAALVLQAVQFAAIATLMTEERGGRTRGGLRRALLEVPAIVAAAIRTVRASGVLVALVAVEFLWGFGMTAFEVLTPAKLGVVLGSPDRAAALLGPINTGAWLMAGGGAALVPWLTRHWAPSAAGAALRIAQGASVLGIALAAGPIGVVIAYVLTMGVHGAANPVHAGLLHRAVVDPGNRATVVSANSLTAQTGGMLGGIALGALADATSLTTAIIVGAVVLAAAAPLYLVAGHSRHQRVTPGTEWAPVSAASSSGDTAALA
jgi:MFS family permease